MDENIRAEIVENSIYVLGKSPFKTQIKNEKSIISNKVLIIEEKINFPNILYILRESFIGLKWDEYSSFSDRLFQWESD